MFARGLTSILIIVGIALSLCCDSQQPTDPKDRGYVVRIGSYDFSENQILAEVYAEVLRRSDVKVSVIHGIGTREVVEPALEQGHVDLVVDYLGTALDFVDPAQQVAHGNPEEAHAALRSQLAPRGVSVLDFAPAQDQNGFAVTSAFAELHQVSRLSDLVELAPSLRFGAPPECPTRTYCLIGLQQTYGINFGSFVPMPSRNATAEALVSGEIDVGLLETTDARLSTSQFLLLLDDRGLQPSENVVPLVSTTTLDAMGERVRQAIDRVTARLTTEVLIELNHAVEVDGRSAADAAADWVRKVS